MAATKSNAPWSVKGIERDARETAKEAASKEGMTVGAWLNQMIYNAGEPTSSGGVVDGLKLRDVITAIEALNNRAASAENKSAEQIDQLVRNFGGIVERVQRLERGGSGDEALAQRVTHLESKSTDRQRIDTLKALEKAVGQVALQFDSAHKQSIERLDTQEKQLQQLAGRLEGAESDPQAASAINYLKNAVDGLAARISRAERIASEASKLSAESAEPVDAEFVERTGTRLRVLGDEIKRGGDQIQSLEATIVKLSSQIDAAEKRSAEGVHKVSETITELRQRFSSVDETEGETHEQLQAAVAEVTERTEKRISDLQNSFEDMVARLQQSRQSTPLTAPEAAEQTAPSKSHALLETAKSQAAHQASAALGNFDDEDDFDDFDDLNEEATPIFDLDTEAGDLNDDEFSVDLDNDLTTETTIADLEGNNAEDDDILSQVRQAYGEDEINDPLTDNLEVDAVTDVTPATRSSDTSNDLDDVLAELAGMGFQEEANEAAPDTPAPDAFLGDLALPAEEPPAPAAKNRPQAEEQNQTSTTETDATPRKTKRQLTPKQRAILAARIRRKQKEAASNATAPVKEDRSGNAAAVIEPSIDETEEQTKTSLLGKLGSAFSGITGRSKGDKDDAAEQKKTAKTEQVDSNLGGILDTDSDEDESNQHNTRPDAKSALRGITSRPVTVALAVSIILAAVALFFIVKDVFLAPPKASPETRIAVTAPVTETAPTTTPEPETIIRETPAAPTVQPRDLYLESVAALQLAQTPEAETAAMQQMREAAALGHPPAQLQLGEFYKTGQGVDQDLSQARIWYERSANGGNILAMHRAGVMSAQGEGGPVDMTAAIEWFKQAGNRALVDSQYNLGALYHPSGDIAEGGIQNAGQAYYWYSIAANNGDDQAASLAAGLAASLDATVKSELDTAVTAWVPTPANPTANEVSPAS